MKIRVYYEDTDTGGIVYHSKYINFCERARSEVLFLRGKSPISQDGFFVVKHLDASFKKSAKIGDLLEVKNKLLWYKSASFALKQTIYKGIDKIFEMDIVLVYVNFDGKIIRMSKNILKDIQDSFKTKA